MISSDFFQRLLRETEYERKTHIQCQKLPGRLFKAFPYLIDSKFAMLRLPFEFSCLSPALLCAFRRNACFIYLVQCHYWVHFLGQLLSLTVGEIISLLFPCQYPPWEEKIIKQMAVKTLMKSHKIFNRNQTSPSPHSPITKVFLPTARSLIPIKDFVRFH